MDSKAETVDMRGEFTLDDIIELLDGRKGGGYLQIMKTNVDGIEDLYPVSFGYKGEARNWVRAVKSRLESGEARISPMYIAHKLKKG